MRKEIIRKGGGGITARKRSMLKRERETKTLLAVSIHLLVPHQASLSFTFKFPLLSLTSLLALVFLLTTGIEPTSPSFTYFTPISPFLISTEQQSYNLESSYISSPYALQHCLQIFFKWEQLGVTMQKCVLMVYRV